MKPRVLLHNERQNAFSQRYRYVKVGAPLPHVLNVFSRFWEFGVFSLSTVIAKGRYEARSNVHEVRKVKFTHAEDDEVVGHPRRPQLKPTNPVLIPSIQSLACFDPRFALSVALTLSDYAVSSALLSVARRIVHLVPVGLYSRFVTDPRNGTAINFTLRVVTMWRNLALHGTALHGTALHGTARHHAVQHGGCTPVPDGCLLVVGLPAFSEGASPHLSSNDELTSVYCSFFPRPPHTLSHVLK